jgi:hypothetical protein
MRFFQKATLPGYYLWWHYTTALVDFGGVVRNLAWFLWNFFSIPLLLKTLIAPWRRLVDTEVSKSGIETLLSHVIINTVMRIVGLGARVVTISFGVLSLILLCAGAAIALVGWLLLPLIIAVLVLLALARFLIFFS